MVEQRPPVDIRYDFIFPDGTRDTHRLRFDSRTLELLDGATDGPDWTLLERQRCPNCPMSAEESRHCPAALAIAPYMERWSRLFSFEDVRVEVTTDSRTVVKDTSVQRAFGSLLGLLLATSGCPRTGFLRPMARFHLPFADEVETAYRATSMHLLAHYFRRERGEAVDFDFDDLVERYRELQVVNSHLAARLRATSEKDGVLNAVVLLDVLARTLPHFIDDRLKELRGWFLQE